MTNESDQRYIFLTNKHRTPNGTILECKHKHDIQFHTDTVSGEQYMIDGLGWYIRTSINKVPMKNLCVTTDDPFELQREAFKWKSYGKNREYPEGIYLKLKDMTDEHIENILDDQYHIKGTYVEELFLKEQEYRKIVGISIKE